MQLLTFPLTDSFRCDPATVLMLEQELAKENVEARKSVCPSLLGGAGMRKVSLFRDGDCPMFNPLLLNNLQWVGHFNPKGNQTRLKNLKNDDDLFPL